MNFNQISQNWDDWKNYLGQAVEFAEELGLSDDHIKNMAVQAGTILAQNVPPANPEQKLLKELWEIADQQEQKVLAGLMTKISRRR